MAHNQLRLRGVLDLADALRQLPAAFTTEAGAIIVATATAAETEMDGRYAAHDVTGALRRGLSMTQDVDAGRFGVAARLQNRDQKAYWAEYGTQIRQTTLGANRGAMPPLAIFIPIAQRHRRLMVERLIDLVERAGFVVGNREIG